jgi:hypothetical protein
MGFQRQSAAESSARRTRVSGNGGVVIVESVADACRSMRGPWRIACWRGVGTGMHR